MTKSDLANPDLERLQQAAIKVLRENRPMNPPLLFFVAPLAEWFEARHIELVREADFPEARRAFNPVFIHLPADGCRLTELAAKANMSKQAMSELVEELIDLGYLTRFPDPKDGRAKIILRTDKGISIHHTTMAAFHQAEKELGELVDAETMTDLRARLAEVAGALRDFKDRIRNEDGEDN